MSYGAYVASGAQLAQQQWGAVQQAVVTVSRFGNMTVVDKVLPDMLDLIDNHW
jgi:hypothetical protein